ncbi:thiol:disulfide interchange protein DsbA/DsbL [Motiliproteus sediminis]|uniref:thiol:disulfide interchange protein DsbA/DsbL n=1 Tax=Motiliproteus sediminis TaxID=1468178 RepID=UPI001AF01982|nr:thiol:disulfide interchange protein DsbA/DsbL [Motiliproteus sediminis]
MLNWLKRSAMALVMIPLLSTTALAADFKEGVHYTKLPKEVRTADPSKVEVVEMFGYWCPHCNNFERYLGPWKKQQDDSVDFKHIPVVFRGNQEEFARAYYVAKALEVEEQAHPQLFNLIHRQRQWINNKEQLGQFFAGLGVSADDFDKAYSSFAINSQMNWGRKKAGEYRISGVPSMVVNGKYLVTAEKAGGQRQMLEVVDFLVAKEKAAQ